MINNIFCYIVKNYNPYAQLSTRTLRQPPQLFSRELRRRRQVGRTAAERSPEMHFYAFNDRVPRLFLSSLTRRLHITLIDCRDDLSEEDEAY